MKSIIFSFFQSKKPIVYYIVAALFLLLEMGIQSSPSVMAPQLMHQLSLGSMAFGVAMGFYFLSYTFMQLPVGLLFDRYGSKSLLVLATLLCACGSYFFSVASGVWMLGLARCLTGLGSAFAFVGVLVIADQWFKAQYFALLVGIAQLLAAFGAMLGQMPLAYWVNDYGWRHASLILAVLASVLALMMLALLQQSPKKRMDKVKRSTWTSIKNILGQQSSWWIACYAFTAWAPIAFFAELWGVPFLMIKFGQSNVLAAKSTTMIWVALAIVSPTIGWLSVRYQIRRFFLILCALCGLVASLILLYLPALNQITVISCMLMIGAAASAQILAFSLIRDKFPNQDLGVAIAFVNMAVVIGGALFQPLVGVLLHLSSMFYFGEAGHALTLQDYQWALLVMPICYGVGLCVALFRLN